MKSPVQRELLAKLDSALEVSPEVRMGQLVAQLGVLAEDEFGRSLWDIDDDQLLQIVDRYIAELSSRQQSVA